MAEDDKTQSGSQVEELGTESRREFVGNLVKYSALSSIALGGAMLTSGSAEAQDQKKKGELDEKTIKELLEMLEHYKGAKANYSKKLGEPKGEGSFRCTSMWYI